MIIGIPKESLSGETRVALLPLEIKRFSSDNLTLNIEIGAGIGSFISDENYTESGAEIIPDVYLNSDLIIRINPPSEEEISKLQEGSCLVSLLAPFTNHNLVKQLAAKIFHHSVWNSYPAAHTPNLWTFSVLRQLLPDTRLCSMRLHIWVNFSPCL